MAWEALRGLLYAPSTPTRPEGPGTSQVWGSMASRRLGECRGSWICRGMGGCRARGKAVLRHGDCANRPFLWRWPGWRLV